MSKVEDENVPVRRKRLSIFDQAPMRSVSTLFQGLKDVTRSVSLSLGVSNEHTPTPVKHVDPLEEKRHQEILHQAKLSHNKPTANLAIHVKQVEVIDLNPNNTFIKNDLNVYIRVHVGQQIKCTSAFEGVIAPTKIIFDSIKHFLIEVSPERAEPSNHIRFEVMAFENAKSSVHHIISVKEIHIYDIIKKLYSVDSMDMYRKDKPVAVIDVEYAFSYGLFGYGYSNQFENRQKTPKDTVTHSMFCRDDPPYSRLDPYSNIMTPRPVGHPPFINFTEKVEIGDAAKIFRSEMNLHDCQQIEEPVLLVSKIKRRMFKLQSEYNNQPNRKARINYLREMVHGNVPESDVGKGTVTMHHKFNLRRRQHMRPTGMFEDSGDDSVFIFADGTTADRDELEALSKVIDQAPGIITRMRINEYLERKRRHEATKGKEQTEPASRNPTFQFAQGFFSRVFSRKRSTVQSEDVHNQPATVTKTQPSSQAPKKSLPSNVIGVMEEQTEATINEQTNRNNPEHRQVVDIISEGNDEETGPGEDAAVARASIASANFGKKMAKSSLLLQNKRSSLSKENEWKERRASMLESAVVKLRKLVVHEEEKIEQQVYVPKVTVNPGTPEETDEDEDSD